ncbi:activator of Hsp90 ATPase-like protein [Microterricola gilva]|uniref:Activator of Hsp90 ATPase-like protein n=1 Tax=Microterricola gilva TaxID=393267 RepID=A0A4Q8AM22_9MICO|nr:SRPBCC domain-containing protein [Microterricola gilva]RZU65617.1 activator of Hsp90 ATPase-like protein [Microterricola gilva]
MTENFTTTITVDATPQRAFDAINDVPGWWGRITGSTTAVGDEFVYVVPGLHYSGFRVAAVEPARRIAWLVTGSYLDFVADKQEWTGTTVRFDIERAGDQTRITFTHEGLAPEDECYEVCSNAWGMFVNGSLRRFIETGHGEPYRFGGDEELSAADHSRLHEQVAQAAGRAGDAG